MKKLLTAVAFIAILSACGTATDIQDTVACIAECRAAIIPEGLSDEEYKEALKTYKDQLVACNVNCNTANAIAAKTTTTSTSEE